MIARREERRIHRPPSHDEIQKQSERVLIEEARADRKKELLAPLRSVEKNTRHGVHVEERTMIRNPSQSALARRGLDVLEAVDVHDVVSGKMNPTGAHCALAPCPESFPRAAIHPSRESIGEAFEW